MNKKTLPISVLMLLSLFAIPAFSQLDTGIFSGRVTDSSGAVVPNAPITVVETETNFTTDTQTNAEGLYRLPTLRPGNYKITVKAAGFKTAIREGLVLGVGDNQEVNIALEVGGTSDSVVVTAEAAQLQTETSSHSETLEGSYLTQLPLYQRYVELTFFLLPNIDGQGVTYGGNLNGFHIDGLSDVKIGFFQDGSYAAANDSGTVYTAQAIQSTIEEVKELGTVLPAEYGHSGGGALIAVQRTGTNTLHGDFSEFGRVSAMQQRKYFDLGKLGQELPGETTDPPSELFMEPNATLSGPVYIPKVYDGRNKTFFVFAVERVIEKQGKQAAYTVPTPQMLGGDFSFTGDGVNPNQLYLPQSTTLVNGVYQRTPIPGNIIPQSLINPVALKFISLNPYATPDTPGTFSNTGPNNNFNGTYLKKYFSENYTGRVDQQINPSFKMFGNWIYKSIYQRSPNPQISVGALDGSLVVTHNYDHTATFGVTKIISPTLINEFRLGYNRYVNQTTGPDVNANTAQLLGIPNDSGAYLPGGLPLTVGTPSENVIENFTIKDDMTWVKNNHSFKFGYDLLHEREDYYTLGNPSGTFTFDSAAGLAGNCPTANISGASTCPNTGGISFASFMLGSVDSSAFSIPTASWLPRDNIHGTYIQDDWKIRSNLTLNIGVRWSMESPWHTKYGQYSMFNPTLPDNVVAGDTGTITHPGGNMTQREWQRPEPRIGFAYHPFNKLVIRSGFAMMHVDLGLADGGSNSSDQLDEYTFQASQNQPSGNPTPLYQINNFPGVTYGGLTAQGVQPYAGCSNGTLNGTTMLTCSGRTTTYDNPHLHDPYALTWNYGMQYQLFTNTMVELSYDGTVGVGNIETPNLNVLPESIDAGNTTALAALTGNSQVYRPYPQFGTITYRANISHSSYHAGTVHVQKRLAHGLYYDTFFTYSKSIDGSGVGNVDVPSIDYKGPSAFDRRFRYVGNFTYNIPLGKGQRFMNRGGILNAVFGGYTLNWVYDVYSGNPISWGTTNSPYTYLPSFIGITGRPNLIGTPALSPTWQLLGNNIFSEGFQNPTINGLQDFAYPGNYQFGNAGRDTFYLPRQIGASFSAYKEFTLKERMKLQLRLDFQNPFKWYNWATGINTTVDLKNVMAGTTTETSGNLFGKVSSGSEATTAADGGTPMMNATIRLRF
jgi:hypothetical protein